MHHHVYTETRRHAAMTRHDHAYAGMESIERIIQRNRTQHKRDGERSISTVNIPANSMSTMVTKIRTDREQCRLNTEVRSLRSRFLRCACRLYLSCLPQLNVCACVFMLANEVGWITCVWKFTVCSTIDTIQRVRIYIMGIICAAAQG